MPDYNYSIFKITWQSLFLTFRVIFWVEAAMTKTVPDDLTSWMSTVRGELTESECMRYCWYFEIQTSHQISFYWKSISKPSNHTNLAHKRQSLCFLLNIKADISKEHITLQWHISINGAKYLNFCFVFPKKYPYLKHKRPPLYFFKYFSLSESTHPEEIPILSVGLYGYFLEPLIFKKPSISYHKKIKMYACCHTSAILEHGNNEVQWDKEAGISVATDHGSLVIT